MGSQNRILFETCATYCTLLVVSLSHIQLHLHGGVASKDRVARLAEALHGGPLGGVAGELRHEAAEAAAAPPQPPQVGDRQACVIPGQVIPMHTLDAVHELHAHGYHA